MPSSIDEMPFIERQQFYNGQRLFAADLQGLEAFNREMRWLHNRSLHQAGIGNGLAVFGKKGDRSVTIQPGYAIDAAGREIVLTEGHTEPVPPVAGEADGKAKSYDLTVAYPDDEDLEVSELRDGVCLARGAVRLREAPVFCWVPLVGASDKVAQSVKMGLRIVLARVGIADCQLQSDVRDEAIAVRRSARPAKQPYVACGGAGLSAWSARLVSLGFTVAGSNRWLTLSGKVDTQAAQFQTTPCYSAHLIGPSELLVDARPVLLVEHTHIEEPQPKSFQAVAFILATAQSVPPVVEPGPTELLEVAEAPVGELVAAVALSDLDKKIVEAIKKDWHLIWMGVEG